MISEAHGVVIAGGSLVMMARLESLDGVAIVPADIYSASYTIVARETCGVEPEIQVPGHTQETIEPASVLYGTMQTGPAWDLDATGYNFRHTIDTTVEVAFQTAGNHYAVRYELTPVNGQPIIFRFHIEAI
ncbi:hypothetical protein MalM25_34240 [Planctomycetes bacterium MalM25]|nr:hypothetical protein MalM25_34240 [Planctomycetes bacterium MalM25]